MNDHNTLRNREIPSYNDLINRAQSDLNDFGKISPRDAQALIDALNELTSSKVFVCNGGGEDE